MSIVNVGDAEPRHMKRALPVGVYLAMGCTTLVLTAPFVRPGADDNTKDVIRARSFVLVDSKGRERAELAVTDDGSARLLIRDKNGARGTWLGVRGDGVQALALTDADGLAYLELQAERERPSLTLYHGKDAASRTERAKLFVDKDGAVCLRLTHPAGASAVRAVCRADGTADITLFKDKKMQASVWLDKRGAGSFGLFEGRDKPRMSLEVAEDGTPSLHMIDRQGKTKSISP